MDKRLQQQIEFIIEADKLKNVIRRNFLTDDSRRENVAEHTWHSILLAQVFFEYAENKHQLDLLHIIRMLTIHDLVEIYAGDTFIFDKEGYKEKFNRENQAAKKLFSMLPYDQGKEFYELWLEFESEKTPNAILACVIDKLMPVMLNTYSKGTSWKEAGISSEQVFDTLKIIKKGPKKMYDLLQNLVGKALEEKSLLPG